MLPFRAQWGPFYYIFDPHKLGIGLYFYWHVNGGYSTFELDFLFFTFGVVFNRGGNGPHNETLNGV